MQSAYWQLTRDTRQIVNKHKAPQNVSEKIIIETCSRLPGRGLSLNQLGGHVDTKVFSKACMDILHQKSIRFIDFFFGLTECEAPGRCVFGCSCFFRSGLNEDGRWPWPTLPAEESLSWQCWDIGMWCYKVLQGSGLILPQEMFFFVSLRLNGQHLLDARSTSFEPWGRRE